MMTDVEWSFDLGERVVMPEDRIEIIESQLYQIRESCGVIQHHATKLMESNNDLNEEFLNDLWVWCGETSIGTHNYSDEDGLREESGW